MPYPLLTQHFVWFYLQIDKGIITKLALDELKDESVSIIKHTCCDKVKNTTLVEINNTLVEQVKEIKVNCEDCKYTDGTLATKIK